MAPIDISGLGAIAVGILSAIGGVSGTAMFMRRRLSRDGTEVAKDRAETNLVVTLQAERDAAEKEAAEVRQQRTRDAEAIARLTVENEYLKADIARVSSEMRKRTRGLPMDVQRILETNYGGLDDLPHPQE